MSEHAAADADAQRPGGDPEAAGTVEDSAVTTEQPVGGDASDAGDADADPAGAGDADAGDADVPDATADGGGDADEAAEGEDTSAPDLDEDSALDAALEALLLVVDVPAGEELLAGALDQPVERVRQALHRLSAAYTGAGRGIDLRRAGEGWRLYTRDTFAPYVERYLLEGQRSKLTRAALETLAVIAYRQPVTRSRVAAVRGVNVDGVIRTLLARGLVEEAGTDPETGGTLYCTTELFLERLGLSSLKDLPPLAPLLPEVDAIDDV